MKNFLLIRRATVFPITGILVFFLLLSCQEKVSESVTEAELEQVEKEDVGGDPWVLNIQEATVNNPHYRVAQWTGANMQMVLMSIAPGEEIDLEMHANLDQFIRIEQGEARVIMGETENDLSFERDISGDWAALIPAGYYHNIQNTGDVDLKLYTIYAPPEHPEGTVHQTYEEAREAHEKEHEEEN